MRRRGFTLIELMVSLGVMALLGIALTRILISDSRFISKQDAMLAARQGARAALNTVVAELSSVGDDAVVAATRESLTVRVSHAFGVTCRSPSSTTKVVSLMPVDSVVWSSMDSPGMYWRAQSGAVSRIGGITVTASTDTARCRADSIRVLPGGKLIQLSSIPSAAMPESLAVMQLYGQVTYKFSPSTDLPGRIGLWRLSGASTEELVTPFDTGAGFSYLVGGPNAATLSLRTTALTGASLDSIRGAELRLYAASEATPQGTGAPQVFPLKTRVMFTNKVD